MIAASSLIVVLGMPVIASSDTVTITPVIDLTGLENSVNSAIAALNPDVATLGSDLGAYESTLLGDADLSPTEVGALVALGLIEAGGTLPDTCSALANLEKNIPTSVLGIPLSIAELLGLTPVEVQLVTNYLDNVLQSETQTILKDLSPAALSLLQVNYNTSFFPTAKNPVPGPVNRTTVGYIGLPTFLDVDGQPGLDLCADTEINIGSLTSLITPAELSSLGISLTSLSSLSTLSTSVLSELGTLALSALNLSSLQIDQQVSKLPLSATTLPVNLTAALPNLGNIGFGYNTQNSSAPQGYTTVIKIGSNPLLGISDTTSNPGPSLTQTISLGSTLSINNTWTPVPATMTTGLTMNGDSFSFPNTVSSPSDWTFGLPLGTTGTISANVNELTSATASTASMAVSGLGLSTAYTGGTTPSSSFNASIALGTDSFGTAVAPLPTSFNSCYVVDAITCSNVNTARGGSLTALHSMSFTSSTPATVTQSLILTAAPTVTAVSPATGPSIGGTAVTVTGTNFATNPGGTLIYFGNNAAGNVVCAKTTSCTATVPSGAVGTVNVTASVDGQATPSTATPTTYAYTASTGTATTFPNPGYSCGNSLTSLYAHVTGSDMYEDYNYGTGGATPLGSGHAWLDTNGTPISGCESALGLVSTYAPGTTAGGSTPSGRLGVFTASSGNAANSLTKTGAVTCPAGTNLNFSLLGALGVLEGVPSSGDVTNWICPTPPVNTAVPVITPSSPVYWGSTLTTTNGTWTPTDMANSTAVQWYRCTTAATPVCTQISGANTNSYSPTNLDLGDTLEVVATNSNSDGSTSATSAKTAVVATPPPPVPSTPLPVVTVTGPETLSTTNGTFTSPVPTTPHYQWQLCTTATSCTNIGGATSSTLTIANGADQGDLLQVVVAATNVAGGTGIETSNQFAVPNIPSNSVIPFMSDTTQGVTDVTAGGGSDVTQADTLKANNGTWAPTSGVTYADVWSHCTTAATPVCTQVGTGPTYVLAKSDVGFTMQLTVTATDFSGSASASSAQSNVVSPASLLFQTPGSVVDGTVNAVAPDGNGNTYVGGSFDTIGPGVGGAGSVSLSSATGKDVTNAAHATGGNVLAITGDGSGGYFIGGSFTAVQQTPCASLAHITSAGALDAAYCFPTGTGPVNALDRNASNVLAVGGSFTVSGDKNLVFFDNTGVMHASGADPNGPVNALVDDAASFMVGGQFTSLAASTPITVGNLAKWIVSGSGATFTAAPNTSYVQSVLNCFPVAFAKTAGCTPTSTPASVDALSIVKEVDAVTLTGQVAIGYYVLIGGSFNSETAGNGTPGSAAGVARANAAVTTTGTVCNVNPATGSISPAETAAQVQPTTCTTTGAGSLGTWVPNPNGVVRSITSGGVVGAANIVTNEQSTPVYLAGDFTAVGAASTAVQGIAEYGLNGVGAPGVVATTAPAAQLGVNWVASPNVQTPSTTWIPTVSAGGAAVSVKAIAMDANGNLEAGGNFTSVLGHAAYRIVQLTPNTSATSTATASTTWTPDAGNVVDAIAESGTNVLVGGSFLVLGGSPYLNVAETDANGNVVPSFNPGANGTVDALAYSGGSIYVGGSFTNLGGTPEANLGALTSSGSALAGFTAPALTKPVFALTVANNSLYVGGTFATIGGTAHNGLAAINGASGAVSSWSPALSSGAIVNAIAATSSDVYAGGVFTAGTQSNAAEFNSLSAAQTAWNPSSASGPVMAITIGSSAVFLGGAFGVTSVDPASGAANWTDASTGVVDALALSGDGNTVFVGGGFTAIAGANRGNMAGLQTSGGARTSFNPGASNAVTAMSLTTSGGQDTLVVGGSMQTIGGLISGGFGIF